MFRSYINAKVRLLGAVTAAGVLWSTKGLAAETLAFGDVYYSGLSTNQVLWATGIAVALAISSVVSGGTAIPAAASAIGAKIGALAGLSGAAATSYGLALLGGGSLAAGGFGMAGGVAVLTALFTFTVAAVPQAALDYGIGKLNESEFVERSKNFVNMPFPIYTKGSQAYSKAMATIASLRPDEAAWSPINQGVLAVARDDLAKTENDPLAEALRGHIALSLNQYPQCYEGASASIRLGKEKSLPAESLTYPIAIGVVCRLGLKETDKPAVDAILEDVKVILREELNSSKGQYVLIWLAAFLDRYFGRDDILDDRILKKLLSYASIISDYSIQHQYIMLISTRYNAKLNYYASVIKSLYDNRDNPTVVGDPGARSFMDRIYENYLSLNTLADGMLAFTAILDAKMSYTYAVRWYYKDEIADESKSIASLRGSIEKHRNLLPETADWADAFKQALNKGAPT